MMHRMKKKIPLSKIFHLLSYIKSWNLEGIIFFSSFHLEWWVLCFVVGFCFNNRKNWIFSYIKLQRLCKPVSLSVHRCGFDMMTTERRRKAQFACQPINIHHYCVFHFTELLFLLVNGGLLAGGRNFGFAPGKSIDLGSHYHRASSRTQPENWNDNLVILVKNWSRKPGKKSAVITQP